MVHGHLTTDNVFFARELVSVEFRVADHVSEDVKIAIRVLSKAVDPINGAIEGCVGIHITTERLNALRDLCRVTLGRAFEEHVLHAMSDAGTRVLLLMKAASLDPDLHTDKRMRMVWADDELQAIGQSRHMGGEWRNGDGGRFGGGAWGHVGVLHGTEWSPLNQGKKKRSNEHALGGGQERLTKSSGEVVAPVEVLEAISIVASEVTDFDEIIDDVANIEATGDTPLIEKDECHGAILGDDVVTEASEKFLTTDVLIVITSAEFEASMGESVADQLISGGVVARIFFEAAMDGLSKTDLGRHD
jgi:hypothetical protein